jgi:nitrate/nitrite-specific signal transduction histidine kinase
VYVPLTAILAGIFAASITLSQKLFIAITGASSDAATVFTTLIVVAAFEPLKSGLQHLVDRRFKEARDTTKELHAIRDHANALLQMIDIEPSTRHLLDAAVRALDATGGAVFLEQNGESRIAYTSGDWKGNTALRVPIEGDSARLGELALGARRNGAEYSEQDRAALQETVAPVARTLALTRQLNGVRE